MQRRKQKNEFGIISSASAIRKIPNSMNVDDGYGWKGVFFPSIILLLSLLSFLPGADIACAGDVKGKVSIVGGTDNANAVIYIETIDSMFAPPDMPAVVDQKHLEFIPEVLPVLAGTAVKFLNSDEVLHDVFTPSPCAGSFNLGSFPHNESKTFIFKKPGCAALILCDIHPEMQAWILVLQNPYFAMSDGEGNYVIRAIPPGEYTLKAWFGYYKTQSVRLVVSQTGTVNVDFQLKQ